MADEVEIRIRVDTSLADGWGGERWTIEDVVDEGTGCSFGDIGIYDFDAHSDFSGRIQDAVIEVLKEGQTFKEGVFYSLFVRVMSGGSELGFSSWHFWAGKETAES